MQELGWVQQYNQQPPLFEDRDRDPAPGSPPAPMNTNVVPAFPSLCPGDPDAQKKLIGLDACSNL